MTNTPTPGRFVTLRGLYARSNGADECPAVITRVWSGDMINVTAFPDGKTPQPVTSVRLYADRAAAMDARGRQDGPALYAERAEPGDTPAPASWKDLSDEQRAEWSRFADDVSVAFWPDRV